MGEIRSAFEIAMEKAGKIEKASPEALRRMEYGPQGSAIAARYLRGEVKDLSGELARHDSSVAGYLIAGMQETLLRNVCLPRDPATQQASTRAMEGVLVLKGNSGSARQVFDQIQHLFAYYDGAVQQAYTQLKSDFEARLGDARKAMELQMGAGVRLDLERIPQFQEEWSRARAALEVQYERVLEEHKQALVGLS